MIKVERAKDILGDFSKRKILVLGDLILDRYVSGNVSRISPEAPVPVVHVSGEYCRPGGAANVALNIRSLGGDVVVAGVVGKDRGAEQLLELLDGNGIDTSGVVVSGDYSTTVKTRVVADRQQIVRVDRENQPETLASCADELCARVSDLVKSVSGLIVEDYGKGVIFQELVDISLASASEVGIPIGFDPKDNHDLDISGITLATPNYKEACAAAGVKEVLLGEKPEDCPELARAASILQAKWHADMLVITLGPHGMCLREKDEQPRVIPTKAREVYDVSGAGDTVISAAFMSLVSGSDLYEAATIANHAAGVVVAKLGTATCTQDELLGAIGEW